MMTGNEIIVLPEELWQSFIISLNHVIAYQYNTKLNLNTQVWLPIPGEERHWITADNLADSIFTKLKNIIGLDFYLPNPIIANGEYWIKRILNQKNIYDTNMGGEGGNIYLFDKKYNLMIFYVYDGGGVLVCGKNRQLLLDSFNKH